MLLLLSVGRWNSQLIFGRVLLLYQMPKAGSQTLEATLRLCGLPHHIVRLHFLSGANGKRIRNFISSGTANAAWQGAANGQMDMLSDVSSALRIRKLMACCGVPLRRVEVITAVRDVLGVALSCIFQNHRLFVPDPKDLTVAKCRELLMRPALCAQFQEWFDTELRPVIGLNVFNTEFPVNKGSCEYQNGFARVLLYRFEELPRLAPVLTKFLGREVPPLVNRNLGVTKDYGEVYRQVKDAISLPQEFTERIINCTLMKQFYSAEERESLKRRWTDAIVSGLDTEPQYLGTA